jgi:O-antigen/teichoic acid export membrane protein
MVYLLVFLIIQYFSIDDLGDFQVVVRPIFMYLTLLFVFPIYRFALPEISVCLKNRDYHQIKLIKTWIIKLSCAVSGTFAILMIICGKRIVMFIFPNQYESAVPLLLSFSLFYIFIMLNAYQLSFKKAVGSFTQSLVIRLTGIISLIFSFFILRSIDDSIIIVIYAWGIGVIVMFIISSFVEHRIMSDLEI